MVLGSKAIINKQVGAIAVQGDDPRKFAAAMVEYNRQKELGSAPAPKGQAPKPNIRKRNKMKVRGLLLLRNFVGVESLSVLCFPSSFILPFCSRQNLLKLDMVLGWKV